MLLSRKATQEHHMIFLVSAIAFLSGQKIKPRADEGTRLFINV
jgi:hypothetical protein